MDPVDDFSQLELGIKTYMKGLNSKMSLINVENLKAITKRKQETAANVRQELLSKADQIVEIVKEMRAEVVENRHSEENIDGCLIGEVDEYISSFESLRD